MDTGLQRIIDTASSLGATIAIWTDTQAEATSLKGKRIRFGMAGNRDTYSAWDPVQPASTMTGTVATIEAEVRRVMTL